MRAARSDRPYMTTPQLAVYLGFRGKKRNESARRWRERHGLPKWWRGNAWLIHPDDVDAVLAGQPLPREER